MRQRYVIPSIASSEITAESAYLKRRDFMRAAGAAALPALAGLSRPAVAAAATGGSPLVYREASSKADGFDTDEQRTPFSDITT